MFAEGPVSSFHDDGMKRAVSDFKWQHLYQLCAVLDLSSHCFSAPFACYVLLLYLPLGKRPMSVELISILI